MRNEAHDANSSDAALPDEPTTLVTLVKDHDRFDMVIRSAGMGYRQLQLLWNRRPLISSMFPRGTAERILRTAMALKEELIGRGWRVVTE